MDSASSSDVTGTATMEWRQMWQQRSKQDLDSWNEDAMEFTARESVTEFDKWMQRFDSGITPVQEQVRLAKQLCSRSQGIQPVGQSAARQGRLDSIVHSKRSSRSYPLDSWKGVTLDWFLNVFMAIPEVQALLPYGCPMWFVRNRCITAILRRRGVRSNGWLVDHIDKFPATGSSSTQLNHGSSVGDATCFISYTGEQSLQEFCDNIDDPRIASAYLWVDMFCICQFSWTEHNDADMTEFEKAFIYNLQNRIARIGLTVLLLGRWDTPMRVLGKIWVLWEIFSTVHAKARLKLLLSPLEAFRYLKNGFSTPEGFQVMEEAMTSLDVRTAKSFVSEDRTLILEAIEKSDGVHTVKEQISKCLFDWFIGVARELYDQRNSEGEKGAHSCGNFSSLLARAGDFSSAERLSREELDVRSAKFGKTHALTLVAMEQLANILLRRGNLSEAGDLQMLVVQEYNSQFGRVHERTVEAEEQIARILRLRGDLGNAETYSRRVVSHTQQLRGPNHSTTLNAMGDLAQLLADNGDGSEARSLQQSACEAL